MSLRELSSAAWSFFLGLDRRLIHVLTAVVLLVPIVMELVLTPPRLKQAQELFDYIEKLSEKRDGRMVLVSVDWGPQTLAELEPVTMALLKHLMYKRIPVVVMTLVYMGQPFTRKVTKEAKEMVEDARREEGLPQDEVEVVYGRDYINVGYQLGGSDVVRGISRDFVGTIVADTDRKPLHDFPMMQDVTGADSFVLMVEITGLVGLFDMWLQWFKQTKPTNFGLGCTSISVPENYIYFDSGQLVGMFEGISGAAAYERLLKERFGLTPNAETYRDMTTQMFGQGFIVFLVVLGNIAYFLGQKRKEWAA